MISGLRPLPPLVPSGTTFPPLKRWDYGYFAMCHMSLQVSIEQICPSGEDVADRRQKGCISIARRAVGLFSSGEARLYGFLSVTVINSNWHATEHP